MHRYSREVIDHFTRYKNQQQGEKMAAYMRHQFQFLGLNAAVRNEVTKEIYKTIGLPDYVHLQPVIEELWEQPYREIHYFAMGLLLKFHTSFEKSTILFLRKLIEQQSWWDTIDFIAPNLVGKFMKTYPEMIDNTINEWMESDNFWLQRSALLFQLKYKKETDTELLSHLIVHLADKNEFFIRKAIGWVLREYSKTDASWVIEFVQTHTLKPLSAKEALKWLKRDRNDFENE